MGSGAEGNETGVPITGAVSEQEGQTPESRTIAIAVIALLIIVILAVRFILLFRK
jgi:hypothetical protein